jgi:ComF family protein
MRLLPLLPGLCPVCHGVGGGGLCVDCTARFAAPRPRCRRCGLGLGVAAETCGACLPEAPPFERCVCVADYGFPWDHLIAQLKFQGHPELAPALARLLAAAVRRDVPGHDRPAWVLPVPLAPARLAERGHNQAWELARALAAELALPARAELLLRPLDAAHQATLGRAERQRNLSGAFMVDPRQRELLRGRTVALVDDVLTTGATAREAAATLLRAGAARVQVWVLARTPEPRARVMDAPEPRARVMDAPEPRARVMDAPEPGAN